MVHYYAVLVWAFPDVWTACLLCSCYTSPRDKRTPCSCFHEQREKEVVLRVGGACAWAVEMSWETLDHILVQDNVSDPQRLAALLLESPWLSQYYNSSCTTHFLTPFSTNSARRSEGAREISWSGGKSARERRLHQTAETGLDGSSEEDVNKYDYHVSVSRGHLQNWHKRWEKISWSGDMICLEPWTAATERIGQW